MANLPADRTKLQAAISNQQPSITASSQANRETLVEAYDTLDLLYQFVSGLVAGGTLQPYPFGVNRQALINSGFAVNQRAVSGTVTLAAGAYGHDRWKAGAAGCTYTFSTVDNVTTITITAGSLVQVIEGIHLYTGTYTLSWTGTAQGKIGAGAYGATGITGAVTGGTNLSIEFNAGTLSQVQFNFGSSAVPFQPRSYSEELALCQRYCQVIVDTSGNFMSYGIGIAVSTVIARPLINLKTRMRIAPTLVATASDFALDDGVSFISLTAITIQQSNPYTVSMACQVASGLTQFRTYQLLANSTNKKITFDAEL